MRYKLALLFLSSWTIAFAFEAPSAPKYGIGMKQAWIPMPDGIRLAANLYMPTGGASGEKFPVILEYLPYRKTEYQGYDYPHYSYYVQRGYVCAKVDIRGTGNSEGHLIAYEYTDQEQEDGEVVIDWLSKQEWSTGKVGMFGISWGGFNSIHMAMRNPPALKAIITVDSTDDLYQDDVHFIDGILHLDGWEFSQDLDNSRPGAPDYKIDDDNFRNRFDTQPWMMTYKRQQRDGPFWDRTALKTRYESIKVPTFMIGGWYDGYRDAIPRMLQHLKAPTKAIIGPWSHTFPHDAYTKPQIEWRNEAVRWFDYWLRGKDTGIMNEPKFAVYVRHWHAPGPRLENVPGEWVWEDGWPIERIKDQTFYPQPDKTLSKSLPSDETHQLRNVPSNGIESGGPVLWWGDVAPDQRPTDAFSLVYDTTILKEDVEILGLPKALLKVSADAPHANWFVLLNDVAPDGSVTQVAGAGFNGTHRESDREPKALKPGEVFPLEIELHFTSWVFAKGHRIRLTINNSQWPMFWPSRYPVTTSLYIGKDSKILLPIVPATPRQKPEFLKPAEDPKLDGFGTLVPSNPSGYNEISKIERDIATKTTRVTAINSIGSKYPWGIEHQDDVFTHETNDDHPENTSMTGNYKFTVELKDRTLIWEAVGIFRSDLNNFYYIYTRKLFENGKLIREKTWNDTIPRDFQ